MTQYKKFTVGKRGTTVYNNFEKLSKTEKSKLNPKDLYKGAEVILKTAHDREDKKKAKQLISQANKNAGLKGNTLVRQNNAQFQRLVDEYWLQDERQQSAKRLEQYAVKRRERNIRKYRKMLEKGGYSTKARGNFLEQGAVPTAIAYGQTKEKFIEAYIHNEKINRPGIGTREEIKNLKAKATKLYEEIQKKGNAIVNTPKGLDKAIRKNVEGFVKQYFKNADPKKTEEILKYLSQLNTSELSDTIDLLTSDKFLRVWEGYQEENDLSGTIDEYEDYASLSDEEKVIVREWKTEEYNSLKAKDRNSKYKTGRTLINKKQVQRQDELLTVLRNETRKNIVRGEKGKLSFEPMKGNVIGKTFEDYLD